MTVFEQNTVETQSEHRHQTPVIAVMSAMRARGTGHEDIFVAMTAMGFAVSCDACRRFVFPKRTTALSRGTERGP